VGGLTCFSPVSEDNPLHLGEGEKLSLNSTNLSCLPPPWTWSATLPLPTYSSCSCAALLSTPLSFQLGLYIDWLLLITFSSCKTCLVTPNGNTNFHVRHHGLTLSNHVYPGKPSLRYQPTKHVEHLQLTRYTCPDTQSANHMFQSSSHRLGWVDTNWWQKPRKTQHC
jgi:hypothetical protein